MEKEDEEVEKTMRLRHFIRNYLNKFFIDHIPIKSFQELPAIYMYLFGTVAYILSVGLFLYFVSTSYQSSLHAPFISITSDAGNCQTVPVAVTNTFLIDNNGNWIGSPQFVYSLSPYVIAFNNFEVSSDDQYEQMMRMFQQELAAIGEQSISQNLAQNLMYWMSYIQYYSVSDPYSQNFSSIGHGQLQSIQLTGDPSDVFDLAIIQGHFINQNGYCPIKSIATYNLANANLRVNLNATQFEHTSTCNSIVNPFSFGYIQTLDKQLFQVNLDVLSFSTAMAVNLGILDMSNLGVASNEFFQFTFQNVTYLSGQYFDTRYPNMDTIVCIRNLTALGTETTTNSDGSTSTTSKGATALCMYLVGQTLALPVFNHFGTSQEEPVYCDCATNGKSDACQQFNLLSSLVFFPAPPSTAAASNSISFLTSSGVFNLLRLVTKYSDYEAFNRASFNASYAAAAPSYGKENSQLRTVSWRRKAFNFCSLSPTSVCSLLTFNTFDVTSKKVSNYKYQLTNGSCTNSIDISEEDWEKLITSPPAPLQQTYYECYQSKDQAIFSAVGIAQGNVQLAVPLLVTALLPLLYLLLVAIKQVPPKEEYTDPEKEQCMESLSILLLRLRDGKTRGVKRNGVLMKLTTELIHAACEEGGLPDSDDEDEDDDESRPSKATHRKSRAKTLSGESIAAPRESNLDRTGVTLDSDDEEEAEEVFQGVSGGIAMTTFKSNKRLSARKRASSGANLTPRRSTLKGPTIGSSTANATVHGGSGLTRNKMAVFVKHLEPPPVSRRTNSEEQQAQTSGNNPAHFLSSVFNGARGRTQSKDAIQNTSISKRGVSMAATTYLDDETNPHCLSYYESVNKVSTDIQIINALDANIGKQKMAPLQGEETDTLVDDLLRTLASCLAMRGGYGQAVNNGDSNKEEFKEVFLKGRMLSMRLIQAFLSELLEREDKTVFIKLSNALCMQASLTLNLEMKTVASQLTDRIAYNIGGKAVTVTQMGALI